MAKKIVVPGRDEFLGILKKEFGSIRAAADAMEIEPPAIYQWDVVPPKRAIHIESLTQGRIQRCLLRPDYFAQAA